MPPHLNQSAIVCQVSFSEKCIPQFHSPYDSDTSVSVQASIVMAPGVPLANRQRERWTERKQREGETECRETTESKTENRETKRERTESERKQRE